MVHLGGPITSLATELAGCGSVFGPPMPGELWIIPSGERYCSEARGGLVRYAELHFDPKVLNALAGKTLLAEPVRARAGHFDSFIYRGTRELELLSQKSDDLSRMTAESLGQTLLLEFYRRYAHPGISKPAFRSIGLSAEEKRVMEQFIAAHLDSALRLEALASAVKMTTHEFLIAFRSAFGTTPAQYVIEQRLRRARFLLLNTLKSIAAIAYETGFSSHAHLTTVFRKRLRMTPQEFRHTHARSEA